ncbi:MAG: hypothetical protein ACF8Q5_03350 [Phycisphaerales bacterium JB040]
MVDLLDTLPLAFDQNDIPVFAIVGGLAFATVAVIFSTIASMANKKQEEETKREIAAYVAEGSMTPDDAERIIASKPKKDCGLS